MVRIAGEFTAVKKSAPLQVRVSRMGYTKQWWAVH
jgi:hypothetical protein